jgi:hypothetical protein
LDVKISTLDTKINTTKGELQTEINNEATARQELGANRIEGNYTDEGV